MHRIGRTGRAGAEGLAVSLVAPEEGRLLRDIKRMLKQEIAVENIAGYEPSRPLNLDGPRPSNGKTRNPNHARRPHVNGPKKPYHAAGNKQHKPWRGERDQRKA